MKTIVLLLAIMIGTFVYGQDSEKSNEAKGTITATVPNLKSEEGKVLFALYTKDNFLKQPSIVPTHSEMHDGKAFATFENVPSGTYALVVLHDKNANKQMDFDASGMPQEDYGTSGNDLSYGPPTWEAAKFDFDGTNGSIEIRF